MMQILLVGVIAIISILAAVALSIGLNTRGDRKKKRRSSTKINAKDRNTIIREANHLLASNPKNPAALGSLADLYYNEGEFKKAMRTYRLLLDQAGPSEAVNDGILNLRYGLSAMKCESWTEAYKSLMIARSKKPEVFEVNVNLGKLEFMRSNDEKAIGFLQQALKAQPDHPESLKYLGQSLHRMKKYSQAMPHLKHAVALRPEDRESLYALARCQYDALQLDPAQKIFQHLRTDPKWGPSAALYSGMIFANKREWEEAATEYQIGLRLRHESVSEKLRLELKYRLAEAFNETQRMERALALLNEIYEAAPGYKDVSVQIKGYRELNSNKNLQVYLLASTNEFIPLCRKITQATFPNAKIKVNEISVRNAEYVDLLTEVRTNKWEDVILFRFMRGEGNVGELFVRDLYAHCRELYAGRGFCFIPGTFSVEAVRFVEARLIDLVDKPALMKILKSIDSGSALDPD